MNHVCVRAWQVVGPLANAVKDFRQRNRWVMWGLIPRNPALVFYSDRFPLSPPRIACTAVGGVSNAGWMRLLCDPLI